MPPAPEQPESADKFLGSLGWVQGPPTLTRADVTRLAQGVAPVPNKTQKAKAKAN